MVHTHERVCTYHHLASGYHFTFFLSLFFFVCQNVVCKCCTSNRRSFGYCPFIPRLKKMFHSLAPPFFSTYLHFVLIPQYSINSCSMWNLLYQFLYVCGMPSHLFDAIDKMDLPTFPATAVLFPCTVSQAFVYYNLSLNFPFWENRQQ